MFNKILFIVPTDEIGGSENILKQLALYYHSKGEMVTVVVMTKMSINSGWSDYQSKIKYIHSSNIFLGYILLILYLKNNYYDLVFCSQVYVNGLLGFLRKVRWYKVRKLILRESTSVFLRFDGFRLWTYFFMYRLGYKQADLIICQTDLMKEQLLKNLFFLNRNKVRVIYNPINLDDVKLKSRMVTESGTIDDMTIVALGRMIPAKGFDILIASFNQIWKSNRDVKLLILGDGSERSKLNGLINKFQMGNSVFMPGYSNNPFPYLKNARVCVVSSISEGFPNTLLQMIALNDNVVSTKCAGGIREMKGIYTAEIDDVDSLSEAISLALTGRDAERNRYFFDKYLSDRSVNVYVAKLESYLCDEI